jgi:hypothetical protein
MSTGNTTGWVKASKSGGGGGNCVEMRRCASSVEVRDTKQNGAGPTLGFTPVGFTAWLDAAKRGEFDHLAEL